jgi:hypothetical protein
MGGSPSLLCHTFTIYSKYSQIWMPHNSEKITHTCALYPMIIQCRENHNNLIEYHSNFTKNVTLTILTHSSCKGNLAVLRLITQASKGGSKENI